MPNQDQRPYASPANVIVVLERARTRNLPEVINNDFLRISGIPEAVFGRVSNALRFLNLIHEDGRPTPRFSELAAAPEAEYREKLARIVREAYRTELAAIDPTQDTQARIADAFRRYEPRSQTKRMVTLFLGLCREARIPVLDAPRERHIREGRLRTASSGQQLRGTTGVDSPLPPLTPQTRETPSQLFSITEYDVAILDESEFAEVWTALGKVARARARARMRQAVPEGEDEKSGQR